MPAPPRSVTSCGSRSRPADHERLAGVDADAHADVVAVAADRVADRERSADGALRVVLARHGRAEERHHRIADELLDRAAVALELAADALPEAVEQPPHVLGIELLRPRGDADAV